MGLNNETPLHSVWKDDLYRMQLKAPVPVPVICDNVLPSLPNYLGRDYHGKISHVQASNLLNDQPNGAYLVRDSKCSNGEFHTLSLKFNDKIHHYKLYYDPSSGLYVREKRYDCVRSLVADGLITMYLELKVPLTLQRLPTANYQESPYMTLNKRKLRVLSKEYMKNKNLNLLQQNQNNQKSCLLSPHQTNTIQIPLSQQILGPTIPEKLEKSHAFKITTFKGLNWCDLCGNFLWGFTAQGTKCDDCGIIAHTRCSDKFPNDCIPDLKYLRGVFGIELTTLLSAHNQKLPFVVTKCVAEVEARGLLTEGIYRLSGFAEEVDAIKMAFDKDGEKADLSQERYPNINVVTGALKLYLRLLPIPLITFIVHPLLIDAMQHKNEDLKISSIKHALMSLPKAHYDTLKFMIEHLNRISIHSALNKMTPHNLATVFAPTLIGPDESLGSILPDMTTDIFLIETLITKCEAIFTPSSTSSSTSNTMKSIVV